MAEYYVITEVFKSYSEALKFILKLSHEAKKQPISVIIKPFQKGFKATYQETK